jgi:hypothetical protein
MSTLSQFRMNVTWRVNKLKTEFEEKVIQVMSGNMTNRMYEIYTIKKDKINHIGNVNNMHNELNLYADCSHISGEQVMNGNYMINDYRNAALIIALDPDALIFNLDGEYMEKLQTKTLMPIDMGNNKFIRLSNDKLDVYNLINNEFIKLSEEASKEVIALFNEQEEFNKGDE